MQFVRTTTPQGETVFIPGSSLKGVFRSFTEKVLRTVDERLTCNPVNREESCENTRLKNLDEKALDYTAQVYKKSCHACKIYGNTRLRGRLGFQDAYPQGNVKTETRYGVAISRLTNAVAQGPFEMEIVVSGQFKGALTLENFEVWQLGLLALTIRAINEGLVKIGFGKNRGFGEVDFRVTKATLDFARTNDPIPPTEIWGVGAFVRDDEERRNYGLKEDDRLTDLPEVEQTDLAILFRRVREREVWGKVAEKALERLPQLLGVEKG